MKSTPKHIVANARQCSRLKVIWRGVALAGAVVPLFVLATTAHAATMPAAPDSAWLFDDSTANDAFGSVDGTAVGDPTYDSLDTPLSFAGNQSAQFDGNDYFAFGASDFNFAATDAFSVAMWVKADSGIAVSKMDHVPGTNNTDDFRGWYVRIVDNNVSVLLREDWDGGAIISSLIGLDTTDSPIGSSKWTHVLVTYDGSEAANGIDIFINGAASTSTSSTEGNDWDNGADITTTRPFALASRNGDTADTTLTGGLDEVAIWEGITLTGDNAEWLASNSVSLIPEPATVGLIVLGGAMLLGRRGRGNHRDVGLHA